MSKIGDKFIFEITETGLASDNTNVLKSGDCEKVVCIAEKHMDKLEKHQTWIPISEKLPPVGSCVIVTVKEHYRKQLELRYPVWYMEKTYERGYAFYFGEIGNILIPDISEVIAWMPMPIPYEPNDLDWSERG